MAEANNEPANAEGAPKAESTTVAASVPVPSEDPIGFIKYLSKGGVKKVAYYVLDWIHKQTGKEGEVPGAKKEQVTQKEFMGDLKDGSLLAQLANKLSPGAVETVHEAPKEPEKQKQNLEGFMCFLKEKAGLTAEQLPSTESVQKGTSEGFNGLLGGLVQLATNAKEKFQADGINTEQLTAIATQVFGDNFVQSLLSRFRNLFNRNSQSQIVDSAPNTATQPQVATPEKTPLPKNDLDDIPAADASA